jgi:hypothetical protein
MIRLPNWIANWKREGFEWHRKDTVLFEGLMNDVKVRMVSTSQSQPEWRLRYVHRNLEVRHLVLLHV